jgi:hypothetical protein
VFTLADITFATAPVASDLATLGLVLLASAASGALAFPLARLAGLNRLFTSRRRVVPGQVLRTLVACAARQNDAGAAPVADPLVRRGLALAESGADAETIRRELEARPPSVEMALMPAVALAGSLACLGAIINSVQLGVIPAVVGVLCGLALVYGAFVLSAATGAAMDRASRLDPAEVLVRAMLAAACPAIRDGAGPAAVEQILRPLLPPTGEVSCEARLAA